MSLSKKGKRIEKMRYNFTERWKSDTKRKNLFNATKMILFKKLKQFKRTKLE